MIHFYCAETKGIKKYFGLSWWIKFFTRFEYPEFKLNDVFTHVSIGEDITQSGRRLIFESYVVQMLNPYDDPKLTARFVKDHIEVIDRDIFWHIVDKEHSKPYAFLQLLDFIRVWLWRKLFKKDPKNVWFPASSVCSEIGYTSAILHATKYALPFLRAQLLTSNSNFYSPMRLYRLLKEAEHFGEIIFEVKDVRTL